MSEKRYMISEVKKLVGVESHALRYWEEELNLSIPRNEMGHRYYTDEHIKELLTIKKLKEQGFQLRAIKLVLENKLDLASLDEAGMDKLREELNAQCMAAAGTPVVVEKKESAMPSNVTVMPVSRTGAVNVVPDKMEQFRTIMKDIMKEAVEESSEGMTNKVIKQMDYMFRMQDEQTEERFKRLEEVITGEDATEEVAATLQSKKRGLFARKKA